MTEWNASHVIGGFIAGTIAYWIGWYSHAHLHPAHVVVTTVIRVVRP